MPTIEPATPTGRYVLEHEDRAGLSPQPAPSASDPVATGDAMPMRMRTALSAFEAWAAAVIPMLENAGDTEAAAYGRDRIEQSENARTSVRRWSAPDPVASPALRSLLDAIEVMDQKVTHYGEREDGTTVNYIVADSTWHRVLAAARNPNWSVASPAPLDVERLHRIIGYAGEGNRMTHSVKEGVGMIPPLTTTLDPAYSEWVERVAAAIHEDCLLEWQGIAVVDPKRQVTMHMADAHYGMAHDLVRRLERAAQPAPPTEALRLIERIREAVADAQVLADSLPHGWPDAIDLILDAEARRYLAATEEETP